VTASAARYTAGMIRINRDIVIDEREIDEQFVRASGPGGQNVNKVSTAVQLRFGVYRSPSLPPDVRERLIRLAGKRVNSAGELVIVAQRYRSQPQNRADARARLAALIRAAVVTPKKRQKTKPSRAARERRMGEKRRRSDTKQARAKLLSAE
jgi:ribosome-associated protein